MEEIIDVLEIPEEMESEIKQWKIKLEDANWQIDETLSEEEMKEFIKSLQTKENDIRSIRHAYEDYLNEKKRLHDEKIRNESVGKCYRRVKNRPDILGYRNADIHSFKILGGVDGSYADCICLVENNGYPYNIKRDNVSIWGSITFSIKSTGNKFIDDFDEITEEEFIQLKQKWIGRILDDIK